MTSCSTGRSSRSPTGSRCSGSGSTPGGPILFDVPGIMRDPGERDSLIPSVNREMIETLIEDEVIEGGMLPKARSALAAIEKGVQKVHLIDGRVQHSLLVEIFTNAGIGTEITA